MPRYALAPSLFALAVAGMLASGSAIAHVGGKAQHWRINVHLSLR